MFSNDNLAQKILWLNYKSGDITTKNIMTQL